MTEAEIEGEKLLNSAAAARLLHVSKATVVRRVHSGAIPIVGEIEGRGGGYVIRASVIEALAADTVGSGD